MTIGAALFLLAVGAILRFAVTTISTHGIDLHMIGDILMVVGVIGLVIWAVVWAPWAQRRRTGYQRTTLDDDGPAGYRYTERRYEDEYPPR
jgi:heme/copper-type cytochrome/quinol oxidase subunit 2